MKRIEQLNPNEKLVLLQKPQWTTSDIAKYFAISRQEAVKIKRKCRMVDIGAGGTYVLADDVLKEMVNTNRLTEVEIITKCMLGA